MQDLNETKDSHANEVAAQEAQRMTETAASLSSSREVGRRGAFKRLVGYTAPAMLALLLAPDSAAASS